MGSLIFGILTIFAAGCLIGVWVVQREETKAYRRLGDRGRFDFTQAAGNLHYRRKS